MSRIEDSIVWFFTDDTAGRIVALVVWSSLFVMLCVPAWRRLFGAPKTTDDLLFAAWLLMLNRVQFSVQALAQNNSFVDGIRWFSICAGLFYAYVVWPYARRRPR